MRQLCILQLLVSLLASACDDGGSGLAPDTSAEDFTSDTEDSVLPDATADTEDSALPDATDTVPDTEPDSTELDLIEPPFQGMAGLAATSDGRVWPLLAPTGEPFAAREPISAETRALSLWPAGDCVLGTEVGRQHVVRFGPAPHFAVEDIWDLGADSWPVAATPLPDSAIVVSLAARPELIVLANDGSQRTIALPDLDDPDGDPDADAMLFDGEHLLVLLSRLDAQADPDGFDRGDPAVLAVVDPSDGTLLDTLELPLTDARPGLVRIDDDSFAVGLAGQEREDAGGGWFQHAADGAIMLVERGVDGRYVLGPTLVTEEQLGGGLTHFVMLDDYRGVAMTSHLWGFNGATWFQYDPVTAETTTQRIDEPSGDFAGSRTCLSPDRSVVGVMGRKDFLGRGLEAVYLFDTTTHAPLPGSPLELGANSLSCVLTLPR
ncbi:MAG: hypothetical protein RBU37_12910 [Myxococcota bacterium]|jgi:hypothetical protein|nr:hypothetical protein [Myxococcota bacterium]